MTLSMPDRRDSRIHYPDVELLADGPKRPARRKIVVSRSVHVNAKVLRENHRPFIGYTIDRNILTTGLLILSSGWLDSVHNSPGRWRLIRINGTAGRSILLRCLCRNLSNEDNRIRDTVDAGVVQYETGYSEFVNQTLACVNWRIKVLLAHGIRECCWRARGRSWRVGDWLGCPASQYACSGEVAFEVASEASLAQAVDAVTGGA